MMDATVRHRLKTFVHRYDLDPVSIAILLAAIAQLIYYLVQIWSEDEAVRQSQRMTWRYRLNVWLACWFHETTGYQNDVAEFFATLPESDKRSLLQTKGLFLPRDTAEIIGET